MQAAVPDEQAAAKVLFQVIHVPGNNRVNVSWTARTRSAIMRRIVIGARSPLNLTGS